MADKADEVDWECVLGASELTPLIPHVDGRCGEVVDMGPLRLRSGYVGIDAVLTTCWFRKLVLMQEGRAGTAMLQALL